MQAEAKLAPQLKRTGSAPQLAASESSGTTAVPPKPVPPPPLARPIAIPALPRLNLRVPGFQRSRSAPPVPHDPVTAPEKDKEKGTQAQDGAPPSVPEGVVVSPPPDNIQYVGNLGLQPDADVPVEEEKSAQLFTVPTEPALRPTAPVHAKATAPVALVPTPAVVPPPPPEPPIIVATPAAIVRARSAHGAAPGVAAIQPSSQPVAGGPPLAPLAFGPPSRSASPAPSLEQAILVERKRRAASSSGNQTAMKGGWFKSSPLNGGERHGVIVAERVKRDMVPVFVAGDDELPQSQVGAGDARIPDEKDKEGPDKE